MIRLRSLILGGVAGALVTGGSPEALAAPLAAPLATPAAAATPDRASLVGSYDGHQMEIAAMLDLGPDGRFHYALSYGALDEQAQGRWEVDGSRLRLTSDPVVPPRFVVLSARPLQAGRLRLTLDLPSGMDRQYFDALVRFTDGRATELQLGEDGLDLPLDPGEQVVSVTLVLPLYGLEGVAAPLPRGRGGEVRFRFDPNDLGKVAFARQPLIVEPDGLRMERQGRTILFRRSAAP